MKIVIATPLYPPEIGALPSYAKELAKRLAPRHEVTIVTYARLPEKVAGVSIRAVDKRRALPARLLSYFIALARSAKNADIVYALNGASVELPATLMSLVSGKHLIVGIADRPAHEDAARHTLRRLIERFVFSRAAVVLNDMPLPKPEILPFAPHPETALEAYERSWQSHLSVLEAAFTHA